MKTRLIATGAAVTTLLWGAVPAMAHHSFAAEFDGTSA